MAKTYSTVPDKAAGDVFTEAMWDDYIKTNVNNLRVPAACRVYKSSAQSIPNNSFTAITFDSERFDTDAMHSTVTNTNRITFNTAGIYLVGVSLYWTANSTGIRTLQCRLNGSTAIAYDEWNAGASAGPGQTVSFAYAFSVNDYIEMLLYQTSGGSLNMTAGGNYSPEAWAVWLGQTS